jgi:hypothetical protein
MTRTNTNSSLAAANLLAAMLPLMLESTTSGNLLDGLGRLKRFDAQPPPIWALRSPTALALLPVINTATAPVDQNEGQDFFIERATTSKETLLGDFRRWRLYAVNWDGEGAAAPNIESIRLAESFVKHLEEGNVPEAVLNSSGTGGLLWRSDEIYAEVEFLDANRIAYYIERADDKHKGVLNYNADELPPVLVALLQA